MVGTIYGETRAEVLRFIVTSFWTSDHLKAIDIWREKRKQFEEQRKKTS